MFVVIVGSIMLRCELWVGDALMTVMMVWWSFFFFFKQKTAYEMRISDWSSDVCSSDLLRLHVSGKGGEGRSGKGKWPQWPIGADLDTKIGRASCRERVCQYV